MTSNAFKQAPIGPSNDFASFGPLVERTLKDKGLDLGEAEALIKRFESEAIQSVEDIDTFGEELLKDNEFLKDTFGELKNIKSLPDSEKIGKSRSMWELMLKKARKILFTTFVSEGGIRKKISNARINWGRNIEWEKPDDFNGAYNSPPPEGEMHIMRFSYDLGMHPGKWKIEGDKATEQKNVNDKARFKKDICVKLVVKIKDLKKYDKVYYYDKREKLGIVDEISIYRTPLDNDNFYTVYFIDEYGDYQGRVKDKLGDDTLRVRKIK